MTTLHSRVSEAGLAPPVLRLRPAERTVRRSGPLVPLPIDAIAVSAATLSAAAAHGDLYGSQLGWLAAFDVLLMAVLVNRGSYRFRLTRSVLDELSAVAASTVMAAVVVIGIRACVSVDRDAPEQVLRWATVAGLNLSVVRLGSYVGRRNWYRSGQGHPTLIVGAGSVGRQIARRFLERPELGLRPIGFLDKEPRLDERPELELPVLGASWDLEEQVRAYEVDHVVIAFSTAPHHVLVDLVRRCHRLKVHVLLVPRLFEEVAVGNRMEFAGGIPLLRVEPAARGWPIRLKYAVDRVVAASALLLLAPLMLIMALAVRLSSPGPVFFRQRRVGLDGNEFDMLKFRTMIGSADVHGESDAGWVAGIVAAAETETESSTREDRRTPVGRLLRKWSLDELPQLINVLRGEMSVVGPRPERAAMVSLFNQSVYRYPDRHRMKCGMTGWAQVHDLRGETSLVDRIEWDNRYIQNWSLGLDLKILLMTLPAMVRGR
jgi:exopolysaccharide biosynthesis polyprenyl glycosylphosphotransferase